MSEKPDPSCFWCEHLILDGLNSWCELHRAGTVCGDYSENKERVARCNRAEKKEDLPLVVRGKWIVEATDPSNVYAYCSECHEFIDVIKTEISVCPSCGCRMKEDK